jgi:hypothetical protein
MVPKPRETQSQDKLLIINSTDFFHFSWEYNNVLIRHASAFSGDDWYDVRGNLKLIRWLEPTVMHTTTKLQWADMSLKYLIYDCRHIWFKICLRSGLSNGSYAQNIHNLISIFNYMQLEYLVWIPIISTEITSWWLCYDWPLASVRRMLGIRITDELKSTRGN